MWQCVSVGNVAVCLCVCVTVHQAVWMCARQCGQCVPLVQKLANEAGRSQGGEKTQAVINRQTDVAESFFCAFFCRWHHNVYETVITDDRCSNAFLGRLPN